MAIGVLSRYHHSDGLRRNPPVSLGTALQKKKLGLDEVMRRFVIFACFLHSLFFFRLNSGVTVGL